MELFKLPKGACIYYSKKGILIATLLRDKTGWTTYGHPMVLLPNNAEEDAIGFHVLQSLNGTRDGITTDELNKNTQDMFSLVGVSNWDALEKKWESIHIDIEPGQKLIKIIPLHRYETGGYVGSDFVNECEYDASIVGNTIRGLIDGPPRYVVPHEPSHT